MLVIGILMFAAAVVAIETAAVGSVPVDVDVVGTSYATSTGAVFMVGVLSALVGCFALLLMADAWKRRARRRSEMRRLGKERDQLAVEAERARADRIAAAADDDRALVDPHPEVDLRERVATNGPGFIPVPPGEPIERPRHRILHRSRR